MSPTSANAPPEPDRLEQLEQRVENSRLARDTWTLIIGGFAALALIASIVGIGFALRAIDQSEGSVSATGATGAAGGGATQTIDVELGDLFVRPGSVDVPAGTDLIVNVTNHGQLQHDLKLNGETGTDLLDPGAQQEINLGAMTASTQAWCTVPGHKAAGMVLTINVTGGAAAETSATTTAAGAATDDAVIDFTADPPADFKPYDPTLAPAPAGTEHVLTMHATEKVMEVAPGVTQQLWMFNDQYPGPVLRGKVGDLFTVTVVNDGTLGHSLDFHASKVAWNDEMRTIAPGESLVYQFQAQYAGVFMYHCGTAPTLHHIGNGMFGAIIIDPPNLPPVDHEYVIVQSELYLGPQGQPGDLTKMQAFEPDAVVFNGYVNQYSHQPIRVEPNERVRVFVLDAGPSENSAFHIVGTIFDTVFKEGAYKLQPDGTQGGSQALDLQPSQGGFVEFTLAEPGLYPIVTHKFANVGKGASGMFQAGEVAATGGEGH